VDLAQVRARTVEAFGNVFGAHMTGDYGPLSKVVPIAVGA
jgi:hypothetical protein